MHFPIPLALDLLCVDPDFGPVAGLVEGAAHESAPHAITLRVDVDQPFMQYWNARSRGLRQSIRRAMRSLDSTGRALTIRLAESEREIEASLATYSRLESMGWKGKEGTAVRLGTKQGAFYSDMLRRMASRGMAGIYELHLGDRIVASQIVLRNARMLITLKTTYDESDARHSPGFVLDYLMLEREFAERRVAAVEYYTNASVELRRWGTAERTITHHRIYRNSVLPKIAKIVRRLRSKQNADTAAE